MKLTSYQSAVLGEKAEFGLILLRIIEERSRHMQNTLAPLLKMDVESESFRSFVNNLAGYDHLIDAIEIKLFWNGNPGSERVH